MVQKLFLTFHNFKKLVILQVNYQIKYNTWLGAIDFYKMIDYL